LTELKTKPIKEYGPPWIGKAYSLKFYNSFVGIHCIATSPAMNNREIIPKEKTAVEPESISEPEEPETPKEPDEVNLDPAPDVPNIICSTTVDQKVEMPGSQTILQARPIYRINPPPSYPNIARKRGYQGNVVLEVLIDKRGKVLDLVIFSSSGHSILDKTAIASVKKWLFEPGMRGSDKIEMWVRVPIRFKLN